MTRLVQTEPFVGIYGRDITGELCDRLGLPVFCLATKQTTII